MGNEECGCSKQRTIVPRLLLAADASVGVFDASVEVFVDLYDSGRPRLTYVPSRFNSDSSESVVKVPNSRADHVTKDECIHKPDEASHKCHRVSGKILP
jgi:hypothetical protein